MEYNVAALSGPVVSALVAAGVAGGVGVGVVAGAGSAVPAALCIGSNLAAIVGDSGYIAEVLVAALDSPFVGVDSDYIHVGYDHMCVFGTVAGHAFAGPAGEFSDFYAVPYMLHSPLSCLYYQSHKARQQHMSHLY